MRSFADLVDDLMADVRSAPVADLELEAVSFAMALVWASDQPRVAAADVVDRLSSRAGDRAAAVLRAFSLLAPPVLREAAAAQAIDLSGVAGEVGRFEVESAHRAVGPGRVADLVWFRRPDGAAQSFLVVTASDDLGCALLGGGMSGSSAPDDLAERLGSLAAALGLPEFAPVEAGTVLERLRRGAATNRALMAEVSVPLAMGVDIASHALGGSADAVGGIDWTMEEGEDDDERAAFLLRVLERAGADGVDVTDPDALSAWRMDFAELTPREQLRALGLPSVPSGDNPARARRSDRERRNKRKQARKARKRNR